MKHRALVVTLFLLVLCVCNTTVRAQFAIEGAQAGLELGLGLGTNESLEQSLEFHGRGFVQFPIESELLGEFGGGFGTLSGENYETSLLPLDFRLLYGPVSLGNITPFVYAGVGLMKFEVNRIPLFAAVGAEIDGWETIVPVGIGALYKLNQRFDISLRSGYAIALTDDLNPIHDDLNDGYWSFQIGLVVKTVDFADDMDGDGLSAGLEAQLGLNPNNPDSDGDGLSDGDEYLTHKTDPKRSDTDGDGLSDFDEVELFDTDPHNADSDGDGLSDGAEVDTHKTDPLLANTDGDDYDDKTEVANLTDPLDPKDPPPFSGFVLGVGRGVVLEGIIYDTDTSELLPFSFEFLEKMFATMKDIPEGAFEIRCQSYQRGSADDHIALSQERANTVKDYLIKRGAQPERLNAIGVKADETLKDKAGNAPHRIRIDFVRTK